jgi:glycosyltransferase involved in cell wall biosynthesis
MKVCIVSLNIVPLFAGERDGLFGGAEVQASFVAGALEICNQSVSMVVADLSDPGIIPYPVENAYDSSQGVRGLRFLHPRWTGLMSALERADADVYYQRNAGMVTGPVAMFCRQKRKVFVFGAGSDVDFSPSEVAIVSVRDKMLYAYGLKMSSGFIVQNEHQREAAARRFNKPIRVIPNGVRPNDNVSDAPRDTIVWVGAMWRVKRPELFLELARRMPERKFVMIGGGGELAAQIRAEATQLPNVSMMGRVPRPEIDGVLRNAAVLVNTSSVEGFPNAFLEAWNNGVPVVTFNDVDGIIRQEGVGTVCTSIDEMVVAIRALTDNGASHAVRENARQLVRERFSPEVLGPRYVEFFEELLQFKNTSAPGAVVSASRS